jgi:hypothetical protein
MNALPTTSRFARGSVVGAFTHALVYALCGARATVLMPSLYSPIVSVSVLNASAPRTPTSLKLALENSTVGSSAPCAVPAIIFSQGSVA